MIFDVNALVKDLGLREIIGNNYDLAAVKNASAGSGAQGSEKSVFEKVVDNAEHAAPTSLFAELIDFIQSVRVSVYWAIRDQVKEELSAIGKTEEEIASEISVRQKAFDQKLQDKLQDYLVEAEITNILGEKHKGVTRDPQKMAYLVELVRNNASVVSGQNTDNDVKLALSEIQKHSINRAIHAEFCRNIFSNAPDAKAEQILSLGETPEIKRNVLVSFLRIILYPFKFIVDSMDKKRIYGLDKLRLFKDGKEEPRSAEDAKNLQQERLLDYNALNPGLRLQLQAVEIEKGKKQHYAVLDCFVGAEPPNGTLILFHGKNADIHTKPLIDNYRSIGEGYRVIMMEYPGFEPSKGPLSKENISKVTHQLFEDAKSQGFIKGDVTVMGEDFGSYYAARLAKKIGEKEPKLCKGLMLSGSFDNTNNLSRSGKIASYISDAEQLNTGSVLQDLPRTMPLTLLSSDETPLDKIYPKKEELTEAPMPYYAEVLKIGEDGNNNKVLANGLENLRTNIKKSQTLIGGKTRLVDVRATPAVPKAKGGERADR